MTNLSQNGHGHSTKASHQSQLVFGPVGFLLQLFSNLWLGIILAALLFFYCSIGSAMPTVRQLPWLEMTEFEWFNWWPFSVLVILFSLCMITITLRRIPFRKINAGVWMIHTGIIIMTLGSYYYFGTKVEGDTPVFRRHVRISMPGLAEPATLLAVPGARTSAVVGLDRWRFEVQSTNHAWPILSDEHKGEKAYAVNVMVSPPVGQPFIRQLMAGYPQYTEDIIPGQGRAIKSLGRKLVEQNLSLTLEYEPQEYFQVADTWALFLRRVGDTDWIERPIEGMPRYQARVSSRQEVFHDPHDQVAVRPIDVLVPAIDPNDPLADASLHITGYLRYAHLEHRWRDGGPSLNPVLGVTLLADGTDSETLELVAFDRKKRVGPHGLTQFVWVDDEKDLSTLATNSEANLHIEVPKASVSLDVALNAESVVGRDGPFTLIEGTDFAYRVTSVQDNLSIPGANKTLSIAMVEIKTPQETFRRWVADQPEHSRDIHGDSSDPHPGGVTKVDPRIVMRYQPASAPITLAAYPGGLYVATNLGSEPIRKTIKVGETIQLFPEVKLHVDSLMIHAVTETKPYVVPEKHRQLNVKTLFAMAKLEVDTGSGVQARWLPFNRYAMANRQYTSNGRFQYQPVIFSQSHGGKRIEIMFSRQRRKLPNPVTLEDFELDTHIGGYAGSASTIRNYVSQLRFKTDQGWTDATSISVNKPAENGGFWYFQSSWDPPLRSQPTSGMNFTGLGVGNRNGVYIQLAGCCLSVVGMMFAFYVKPVMKRRRAEQSRAKIARNGEVDNAKTSDAKSEASFVEV